MKTQVNRKVLPNTTKVVFFSNYHRKCIIRCSNWIKKKHVKTNLNACIIRKNNHYQNFHIGFYRLFYNDINLAGFLYMNWVLNETVYSPKEK